jgi:hypothetical protein
MRLYAMGSLCMEGIGNIIITIMDSIYNISNQSDHSIEIKGTIQPTTVGGIADGTNRMDDTYGMGATYGTGATYGMGATYRMGATYGTGATYRMDDTCGADDTNRT